MTKSLMDFGGTGDCGFRSIAAGFIDYYQTHRSVVDNDFLNELIAGYRIYFSRDLMDDRLASSKDAFNWLLIHIPPTELVVRLGYVLRQIAVDEMVKNPQNYVGAFADQTENCHPLKMREQNTWIDESSFAALANRMQLAIKVESMGRASRVPTLTYNVAAQKIASDSLVVSYTGAHYMPKLSAPAFFARPSLPRTFLSEPANPNLTVHNDPSLAEIWQKISLAMKLDLEREHGYKQQLAKLDIGILIKIYQTLMLESDYLPGKIRVVTMEHNGDSFFQAAICDTQITPAREADIKSILVQALAKEALIHFQSSEKIFTLAQELSNKPLHGFVNGADDDLSQTSAVKSPIASCS